MQCNTLTSFYAGSSASAWGLWSWARQPWHSSMQGDVGARGQAASSARCELCCRHKPTRPDPRQAGRCPCAELGSVVGACSSCFSCLINLSPRIFCNFRRTNYHTSTLNLLVFTDLPALGQLGSKRMKVGLHIVLQKKLQFLTSYLSCSTSSLTDALPHNP